MKKIQWNSGWTFKNILKDTREVEVVLPHDAMQTEERLPGIINGAAAGFYPGGKYQYRKIFVPTEEMINQSVILEFEGIYHKSEVFLNGSKIGGWINGYTGYTVELTERLRFGKKNEILVIADNSQTPNSRWYTGSGIYRDVYLYVGSKHHIALDGIRVTTESIDPAVLHVETWLEKSETDCDIHVEVYDGDIMVSEGEGRDCKIEIPNPKLWDADCPNLYRVVVSVKENGCIVDKDEVLTGIRSLSWSAETGLLVNGRETKLRGGCIHHTNGILGAVSTRSIEYEKVRKLKEAGFNAIRSAHNPAAKGLLEACDRLGMYVMDEAFDQWQLKKVDYDYSIHFDREWKKDLMAMIRKDYNHPSVIMYSIGNEIGDTGTAEGAAVNRELANFCRDLDGTRPVINCINPVVSVMGGTKSEASSDDEVDPYLQSKTAGATGSLLANMIVTVVPFIQKIICRPKKVEKILKPCFDELDVIGLNYAEQCYEGLHGYDSNRILLGSETHVHTMSKRWRQVLKHPYILGDFMWTAMDYLGEAGVGVPVYNTSAGGFNKPFPCISGGCGAIDLIGHRETAMYAAAIAWGEYNKPYIAVRPVNHSGEKYFYGMWRDTDAIHSWTWPGCEGKQAEIEIYSPGETVELYQDGVSLGRKTLVDGKAVYTALYKSGELRAVCYSREGRELASDKLHTSGDETVLQLHTSAEKFEADTGQYVFVSVDLTDDRGVVKMLQDRLVTVSVTGPATLAAVGSANPITDESYTGCGFTTWNGRMGFYIRSTGETGCVNVVVKADGLGTGCLKMEFL